MDSQEQQTKQAQEQQQRRFADKIVTGALGVVTDSQGRVLFVAQQKGPFAGWWLMPGGGVEPGESAIDAVVREVREETGLTMTNVRFVAVYEMRGAWAGGGYHIMMLAFRGEADGEIPADFVGDGVGGVRWAHLDELPLHSTDLRMLKDAGLADFAEEEIAAALQRDGVTLRVYGT